MAEDEKREVAVVVKTCTEKKSGDGSPYWEIIGTVDGVEGTYYGKEMWDVGPAKGTRYANKPTIYKAKSGGGGGGNFQQKPRDYTIENRQRAFDAVVAHSQGKGDLHDLCTASLKVAEFYAKGTVPPKKEAPQA